MDFLLLVPTLRPVPETQHAITRPPAVSNPPAEKMVHPADHVAAAVGAARQQGANLVAQLGGDALVGVHDQHPAVGGLRDGPVLLRGRVDVFALDDPVGEPARDLEPVSYTHLPSPR